MVTCFSITGRRRARRRQLGHQAPSCDRKVRPRSRSALEVPRSSQDLRGRAALDRRSCTSGESDRCNPTHGCFDCFVHLVPKVAMPVEIDHWFSGFGNTLDQRDVDVLKRCDLVTRHIELFEKVDCSVIERRAEARDSTDFARSTIGPCHSHRVWAGEAREAAARTTATRGSGSGTRHDRHRASSCPPLCMSAVEGLGPGVGGDIDDFEGAMMDPSWSPDTSAMMNGGVFDPIS